MKHKILHSPPISSAKISYLLRTTASLAKQTQLPPTIDTPFFNLDDFTSPEQFQLAAAAHYHKDQERRSFGIKTDCPFCH